MFAANVIQLPSLKKLEEENMAIQNIDGDLKMTEVPK